MYYATTEIRRIFWMKKRLLSFVMCALIVLSSFIMAACSDDEGALERLSSESGDLTTTSSNEHTTICIYSIRGEGTTDEAIELVEKELSRIAVRRYNTSIDLILIDEDQYAAMMFTKIRMAIASYNTARIKDISLLTPEEIAEIRASNVDYLDENGKNYGLKEETNLSSEVLNGTLDIFLCYTPEEGNGALYDPAYEIPENKQYSMFEILYKEKALAPLKSYLSNLYSDLNSVLYTHALEYVTKPTYKDASTKDVYGIPNNYVYGSYDYIIFNEDYVGPIISPNGNGVDKSDYIPIGSSANIQRFNTLVSELEAAQENGTIPADVVITEDGTIPSFATYEEFKAYVDGNGDFAIARVSGSKAVGELLMDDRYENFDVYVENYDKITNTADFCDSMFCIGLNAMGADDSGERVKRSLDILRLINTNKEFRNTLQYGVEGTHYSQYSEDEDVNPLSSARADSKYNQISVAKYLGNMFLLYPNSNMTEAEKLMAENNWQMAKDQIIELVPWVTDPKA